LVPMFSAAILSAYNGARINLNVDLTPSTMVLMRA
jgi:hypothetical protein